MYFGVKPFIASNGLHRYCSSCEVRWEGEERDCFICTLPGEVRSNYGPPFLIHPMIITQRSYEEDS